MALLTVDVGGSISVVLAVDIPGSCTMLEQSNEGVAEVPAKGVKSEEVEIVLEVD